MSTERETPELEKFKRLWTDNRRHNWPATFEGEAFGMIAKLESERDELTERWEKAANAYLIERGAHEATMRERDEARERELKWKAVVSLLYSAAEHASFAFEFEKADMNAACEEFTALRSEVEP